METENCLLGRSKAPGLSPIAWDPDILTSLYCHYLLIFLLFFTHSGYLISLGCILSKNTRDGTALPKAWGEGSCRATHYLVPQDSPSSLCSLLPQGQRESKQSRGKA